ncbi:MAG: hypothetical protein KKA84_07030 [Bacteroidetes bacterium]|nr:hypothetical protein [Bacteroidota bacterium]
MLQNQKNDTINIALVCDKNMEAGLHLTLHSLLKKVSRMVNVYLFHENFTERDIQNLEASLSVFRDKYKLFPRLIEESRFDSQPGLFGKTITYFRLTIPELLSVDKILYLDTDLLVNLDVAKIFDLDMAGFGLAAESMNPVEKCWDSEYLLSKGCDPDSLSLQAGVLLIDCDFWRNNQITKKSIDLLNEDRNKIRTVDQTVLNYLFNGKFLPFEKFTQTSVWPNDKPLPSELSDTIYHFVGVPKPWEFLGEIFHGNYSLYRSEIKGTVFENTNSWNDLTFNKLHRFIRTLRLYFRTFRKRIGWFFERRAKLRNND